MVSMPWCLLWLVRRMASEFSLHILREGLETRNTVDFPAVDNNSRASANTAVLPRFKIGLHPRGVPVLLDGFGEFRFIKTEPSRIGDEILFPKRILMVKAERHKIPEVALTRGGHRSLVR